MDIEFQYVCMYICMYVDIQIYSSSSEGNVDDLAPNVDSESG